MPTCKLDYWPLGVRNEHAAHQEQCRRGVRRGAACASPPHLPSPKPHPATRIPRIPSPSPPLACPPLSSLPVPSRRLLCKKICPSLPLAAEPLSGGGTSSSNHGGSAWGAVQHHASTLPMATGYMLCSSLLMVLNKLALQATLPPCPSHFSTPPFAHFVSRPFHRATALPVSKQSDGASVPLRCSDHSSASSIRQTRRCTARVESGGRYPPSPPSPHGLTCSRLSQASKFLLVPLVFELAIYFNIKLLQVSNVETAIVFRTLVPVITSYADYAYMGREAPSRQSGVGLVIVCLGALLFALASRQGLRIDGWM